MISSFAISFKSLGLNVMTSYCCTVGVGYKGGLCQKDCGGFMKGEK